MIQVRDIMNRTVFANIVIVTVIACNSLILFYGIIHHERVLNWQFGGTGTPFNGITFFYILPTILIIFFGISMRLNEAYKVNIAIVSISTMLTLYLVEAVFLIFNPDIEQFQKTVALKRIGKSYDKRTKLELLQELRQTQKAFSSVVPGLFLLEDGISFMTIHGKTIYPLSGISNVTTVLSKEQGEWLIYESDEHGFHNPKGLYHPGNIDIAVIGDSFTQGAGVPSQKNAVALIRDLYNNTLNFGLSGNGPLIELAILREYVESLKPRIVLWMYFSGNDLNKDIEKERTNAILLRYLDKNYRQNLLSLQTVIDQYLINYVDRRIGERVIRTQNTDIVTLLSNFLFLRQLRIKLKLAFIPPRKSSETQLVESPHYDFNLFRIILTLARDTIASWGGKLYFVYLPSYQFIANPTRGNNQLAYNQILALIKNLEIPLIDICPKFLALDDPLSVFPFQRDGHYNEKGYEIVATTILHTLEQETRADSKKQ